MTDEEYVQRTSQRLADALTDGVRLVHLLARLAAENRLTEQSVKAGMTDGQLAHYERERVRIADDAQRLREAHPYEQWTEREKREWGEAGYEAWLSEM